MAENAMTETPEHMHARLCGVIGQAQFSVLGDAYAWQPIAHTSALSDNALAAVRDGASWAALLPANAEADGAYRIFAFHFAEGSNASGFVAGLIAHERKRTGAMVVCGYDVRATDALWRTRWGCSTIGDVRGPKAMRLSPSCSACATRDQGGKRA